MDTARESRTNPHTQACLALRTITHIRYIQVWPLKSLSRQVLLPPFFPPSLTPSRNCTRYSGQGGAPSCCSRSKAWVRRCSGDAPEMRRPGQGLCVIHACVPSRRTSGGPSLQSQDFQEAATHLNIQRFMVNQVLFGPLPSLSPH